MSNKILSRIDWALAILVIAIGFTIASFGIAQITHGPKRDVQKNAYTVTVRAASGALSAGETTTAVTDVGPFDTASLLVDITTMTTPDVDDEVDFYVQTSYDAGTTWSDLENLHFTNSDNGATFKKLVLLGPLSGFAATSTALNNTDGTLADNTKIAAPLGDRIRVKTAVTGATAPTYAYSATMFVR